MNLPKRFDLTYVNSEGKNEQVVMIHAAIMGSIERFLSVLIEHYAGEFPLWLSSVQAVVLPLSEKFTAYAEQVTVQLRASGFRVEIDDANESLGKRIRLSETQKTPYILVVGAKEEEASTVSIRKRHNAEQSTMKVEQFIENLNKELN